MSDKYIRKGYEINARQYTGNNGNELRQWSNGAIIASPVLEPTKNNPKGCYVQITTKSEGIKIAISEQWILKGTKADCTDEYYVCDAADLGLIL